MPRAAYLANSVVNPSIQEVRVSWEPGKPSQNEDEYFARKDAEWLRERRATLDAERAAKDA